MFFDKIFQNKFIAKKMKNNLIMLFLVLVTLIVGVIISSINNHNTSSKQIKVFTENFKDYITQSTHTRVIEKSKIDEMIKDIDKEKLTYSIQIENRDEGKSSLKYSNQNLPDKLDLEKNNKLVIMVKFLNYDFIEVMTVE